MGEPGPPLLARVGVSPVVPGEADLGESQLPSLAADGLGGVAVRDRLGAGLDIAGDGGGLDQRAVSLLVVDPPLDELRCVLRP